MSQGPEIEDRVDFDQENYMEDMDDYVEEQIDEDVSDGGLEKNNEESVEEEVHEDAPAEDNEKNHSPEADKGEIAVESVQDEQKPSSSIDEDEREEHDQLLSLPPHGSEIFIGGLPRDVSEDDLRDLCEPLGEILEVRLMKDKDTGEGKGYAFVAFKTKEVAQNTIDALHNKEFKSRSLRCSLSETKHRLFIGNVPKTWTEDEFQKVIQRVGPGIENIELIKDPQNSSRNRGFAFVLYYNHACADYSRQKMSNVNFKLDGNTPTVTWADPKTSDQSASAQVKALYVKNIPENTTTEQLKELFSRHGEVTKIVMPPGKTGGKRNFGFIHYAGRSSALKAIKDTEKYEIDGQMLEVVLAKPQTEKQPDAHSYNPGPHANHVPHPAFGGFSPNAYGSVGTGYGVASSFQQPMIYGRGPMPAGMQMVPMVLPDGRIGYVLQQPGVQMPPPPRLRRSNGPSGPSGRGGGGDEGNRSRRYRPY